MERSMADTEVVALRAKLASLPQSDDYRQRRRDFDAFGLAYGSRPDVKLEQVTANGMRAELSSAPGAPPTPRSFICMAAATCSARSTAIATLPRRRAAPPIAWHWR